LEKFSQRKLSGILQYFADLKLNSMLQKYIEYLKDNPQGYWFKRKLYGWGWTPVRWQGWATVLVFAILVVWVARDFAFSVAHVAASASANAANVSAGANAMLFWFVVKIVVLTAVLIFVCYKKGEPLAFQWGFQRSSSGEKSDWRRYQIISQSTPAMRRIQIVLLVLIIIGLVLLATQKLWVGSVVDFILKNYH
jgi:hypothetical protein